MTNNFNPVIPEIPHELPANVASTLRSFLVMFSGYLVGKGWLSADLGSALVAVGLYVAPMALAYWKNHNTKKTVVAALKAPAQ